MLASKLIKNIASANLLTCSSRSYSKTLLCLGSLTEDFEGAKTRLSTLREDPGNAAKLEIYGLFKQATMGPVQSDTPSPGMFDMIGKAKFSAWQALGSMERDEAKEKYIALINKLAGEQVEEVANGRSESEDTQVFSKKSDTLESIGNPRLNVGSVLELKLKTIKVEMSEDGVLTVMLDRPLRGNSFNMDMWNDLRFVFETINQDSAVRVVILTGNEKTFSTGMDLSVFQDMEKLSQKEPCPGRQREALVNVIRWLQGAISGPEMCVVPVIAAVGGHCIGGAVDLITSCDLRYCTDNATFCIKETDLAMVADIGTLQRLPKLVGDMQSRELAYTGRNFSGREAERMGLALKSFPTHAAMIDHVKKTASEISAKSPLTIRGIKSTILYTRDHSVGDGLTQVQMHNAAHLMSSDLMEAMRATFMKETPVYKGH